MLKQIKIVILGIEKECHPLCRRIPSSTPEKALERKGTLPCREKAEKKRDIHSINWTLNFRDTGASSNKKAGIFNALIIDKTNKSHNMVHAINQYVMHYLNFITKLYLIFIWTRHYYPWIWWSFRFQANTMDSPGTHLQFYDQSYYTKIYVLKEIYRLKRHFLLVKLSNSAYESTLKYLINRLGL